MKNSFIVLNLKLKINNTNLIVNALTNFNLAMT